MKIGLIGLGKHGQHAVLPAIERSGQATLVAVADVDPQRVAAIDRPGVQGYSSAEAMLENADLDAVYLATLAPTHAPLAIAAMRRGLHVVCEKPMAESAAACQAMNAVARSTGRFLAVNFESRFYDHLLQLRQWVRDGRLGAVQAIHLTHFWDGHKSFGPVAERRHRLIELAGALDCGIHKLDLARYLTGGGPWQRVQAAGAWLEESFTYPPHIAVLGTLAGGVMVTVNASLTYAAHISPRPMLDLLSVVGTRGVASYCVQVDSPEAIRESPQRLQLTTGDGVEQVPLDHQSHQVHIARLLAVFGPLVRGERSVEWAIEQGLPLGDDGLQAQIATEWAHADALQHRSAVPGDVSGLPLPI